MADEDRVRSRKELEEALARAQSQLQEQATRLATLDTQPQLSAAEYRELKLAQVELAQLRQQAPPPNPGAPPSLVPYKGYVQATEKCFYGSLRESGDVFEVDVSALWSDDPYVAVTIIGQKDDGTPRVESNRSAPEQIDYRFRPKSRDALLAAAAEPQRAQRF